MGKASLGFPEDIPPEIQMSCMRDYQGAITHASIRLPYGICGGSFQETGALSISLQDKDLRHYLQTTHTSPDSCAITHNRLSICLTCNSYIANKTIPPYLQGTLLIDYSVKSIHQLLGTSTLSRNSLLLELMLLALS
jgi:hypothetical protein